MINHTFQLLIHTYKRAGFSIADALEEAVPVRSDMLEDFSSRGWSLPKELKDLYLYKNGISDDWVGENACMLPGFFFQPFERSMNVFERDAESHWQTKMFELLIDFGGDCYCVPIHKDEVEFAPVYRCSSYSRSDVSRYDSIESMFVTIINLIEEGVYENEDGGLVVRAGCRGVIDRVSAELNPNSTYWRQRMRGVYE
ncbi:MAG: hypothetical protein Q7P63_05460 [Verrucomicrobiota bacterium JB022]|nr:hypothetical protein [Verrucomicrobiota bacterium JB022]